MKGPSGARGFSSAAVVGFGFAVLDEYGSYKKPDGYEEEPSWKYGVSTGVARPILGNRKTGFAAAYVHHPAQKAHPYVSGAEQLIGGLANKAYNEAMVATILKAFH